MLKIPGATFWADERNTRLAANRERGGTRHRVGVFGRGANTPIPFHRTWKEDE